MSQQLPPPGYSPQYSFWPYYMAPPEELLGPARWAGWTLVTLGALIVIASGCFGAMVGIVPAAEFEKILAEQRRLDPNMPPISVDVMRTGMAIVFVIAGMVGIVAIILGVLVRKGGRATAIVAMIFCGLCALILGGLILLYLTQGLAAFAAAIFLFGIPLVAVIGVMVLLSRALRAATHVEMARMQMQMAQYQQQMGYYPQGYGQPSPEQPREDRPHYE